MSEKFFAGKSPNAIATPAVALARGWTNLAFFDHFTNPATVDLAKTYAPGFKWYFFSGQDPASATVAGSILTVSGISQGLTLTSATNLSGFGSGKKNNGTVGGALVPGTRGFYLEALLKYDPNDPSATDFDAACWGIDFLSWNLLVSGTAATVANTWAELDFEESRLPAQNVQQIYHSWGTTSGDDQFLPASNPSFASINFANYNLFAVSVITMAENGGTGILRFYVNGTQFGSDITWTAGQRFAAIENSHLQLNFSVDAPMTLKCDYIAMWNAGNVWDGPASGLTHRWPMDDARVSGTTVKDVVGVLNGTAGAGISSALGPMLDQARVSNGVFAQGYIQIGNPIPNLGTAAWSIGFWALLNNPGAAGGGDGNITLLNLYDGGSNFFRLVIDHTSTVGALCASSGAPASLFSTAAAVFAANVYTHITVTYDGAGTYKVYANGINKSLGGAPRLSVPGPNSVLLNSASGADNSVTGRMNELVIYNRELTAAEAVQLFNAYEPQGGSIS